LPNRYTQGIFAMRQQLSRLVMALPLFLVACSHMVGSSRPEPSPMTGPCKAEPAQFAVGRNADAALENEARMRSGARTARVLKPNQAVTMEFNAERLNLTVDQAGRVTRVNCG
jgi:hypothetical protein